jgi:hypothetical protein
MALTQKSSLKPTALQAAAREIRLARFLACTVSDEELVRKAVTAYQEAAKTTRRSSGLPRGGGGS